MALYTIVYWQDIPAVVEARQGRKRHKEQLSQRFQELIDAVAMRKGLFGTDEYLEQWRKSDPVTGEGSVEQLAKSIAENLEAQYETIEAQSMARANEERKARQSE